MAQGVLAAIVDPKRVRDFARGMGLEAKTDRVDAAVIARYGEVRRPAPTPPPEPARAELGEILACRRQPIAEITARRRRLGHLQSPRLRARVEAMLAQPRREGEALAGLARETIRARAGLAAGSALLTSTPGRGPILAATLLAGMPGLGALDRREVAALAGLAPVARDGGPRENRRVIKGGRGRVRRALHMAAVASSRITAGPLEGRYDRLTARGEPPKLALTALMRTMLVTPNATLRTRQAWKDTRHA